MKDFLKKKEKKSINPFNRNKSKVSQLRSKQSVNNNKPKGKFNNLFSKKKPSASAINKRGSAHTQNSTQDDVADIYAAPVSASTDSTIIVEAADYNDSKWYSASGRIGRVQLFAYTFIWLLVLIPIFIVLMVVFSGAMFAMFMGGGGDTAASGSTIMLVLVASLVIVPSVYIGLLLPRRRLQDLNRPVWWLILAFIPVVNMLFGLYYSFMPGDSDFNDYGDPPPPYTKLQLILALALPALYILAMVATFALPEQPGFSELDMDTGSGESTVEDIVAEIEAEMAAEDAAQAQSTDTVSEVGQQGQQYSELQNEPTKDPTEGALDGSMTNDSATVNSGSGVDNAIDSMNIDSDNTIDFDNTGETADRGIAANTEQPPETKEQVDAAINEALGESTEMSFEEFMQSDSKILVE